MGLGWFVFAIVLFFIVTIIIAVYLEQIFGFISTTFDFSRLFPFIAKHFVWGKPANGAGTDGDDVQNAVLSKRGEDV